MPQTRAAFSTGLKIAVEATYSVAPSSSQNSGYWQGGFWFDITTDGLPDIDDRQATIFPQGQAGKRAMNNRAPVVGRKWSDGSFNYEITSDFFPLLAYAAMGSLSSNMIPSTEPDLLLEELLPGAASKSLVLLNQPSDGGAIIRFHIPEAAVSGGWISLSGIDSYGNGASEVISFSTAGSFWTRTSFSSIAASGIEVYSDGAGTLNIQGVQAYEHIISINETSNPSLSIERHGDPTAGATSMSRMYTGMVVQELSMNTPAEARDGLVTGAVTLEGNPTATCVATSLNSVSAVRVWPSWSLSFSRENITYDKVVNFSMDFTAGNRNYRTAAGAQNPQGAVYLGQELTGAIDILLNDETEYNRWQGASSNSMVAKWDSNWKLTSTLNQLIYASMNSLYFEDLSKSEDDGLLQMTGDFRTINDANNGLIKFYFRNNVPGIAYGNSVS